MQQLDLSPSILDSHSGVLEVDKVFLLNLPQHETDFFSLELIIIADNNQIAHDQFLLLSGIEKQRLSLAAMPLCDCDPELSADNYLG